MTNPTVCVFTNKMRREAKIYIIEIHCKFTRLHTILRGFSVHQSCKKTDLISQKFVPRVLLFTMATRWVTCQLIAKELDCIEALHLGYLKQESCFCQGCKNYFNEVVKRPNGRESYGRMFQCTRKALYNVTSQDNHEQHDQLLPEKRKWASDPSDTAEKKTASSHHEAIYYHHRAARKWYQWADALSRGADIM